MLTCLRLGLHIELGDCRSYHYDMTFLRDLYGLRQDSSSELFCYKNRGRERYHWSKLPELYLNYVFPKRPPAYSLQITELRESCFDQFVRSKFLVSADFLLAHDRIYFSAIHDQLSH